jgi:hypothetical protein
MATVIILENPQDKQEKKGKKKEEEEEEELLSLQCKLLETFIQPKKKETIQAVSKLPGKQNQ